LAERDGDPQLHTLNDKTERKLHFDKTKPAFYLENSGSLENLYEQVDALLERISEGIV
jgi:dephospho-CoA kinase